MYEYIKGTLTKITAKYVVIETGGIGYMVHVANPYRYSDSVNETVQLYLYQAIREDAHVLFGFYDEDEKAVFLNLISVTGIGPMTALAIIAADDNAGLVNAIDTADIKYLTKFPKIGKKTAQQMVLELAGKFVAPSDEAASPKATKVNTNVALDEAMEALQALGYKASELKKIRKFFEGTNDTAENYIKNALKML